MTVKGWPMKSSMRKKHKYYSRWRLKRRMQRRFWTRSTWSLKLTSIATFSSLATWEGTPLNSSSQSIISHACRKFLARIVSERTSLKYLRHLEITYWGILHQMLSQRYLTSEDSKESLMNMMIECLATARFLKFFPLSRATKQRRLSSWGHTMGAYMLCAWLSGRNMVKTFNMYCNNWRNGIYPAI